MQNNLPPLCDAERRFFVCSAPTGPGLQISGLRRFRCIVRPFRRCTAIRVFRRSAAGDGHGAVGVKPALQQYLFEQHACPEFENVDHISREDGCKVYFTDGSWVICRFSGTEPLLRMAAEAETDEKAQSYIQTWKAFLSL